MYKYSNARFQTWSSCLLTRWAIWDHLSLVHKKIKNYFFQRRSEASLWGNGLMSRCARHLFYEPATHTFWVVSHSSGAYAPLCGALVQKDFKNYFFQRRSEASLWGNGLILFCGIFVVISVTVYRSIFGLFKIQYFVHAENC